MKKENYLSARLLADTVYCIYSNCERTRVDNGVFFFINEEFFVVYSLSREGATLVLSAIDVAGCDGKYQDLAFDLQAFLESV